MLSLPFLPPYPRTPVHADLPGASPAYAPGIQLYTLRDILKTDLEGTLGALARIGYREVELAGLYDRTAAEFRAILDRAGLTTPAGHRGLPEITDTLDQTIADAKTLGQTYVIVPWLPQEMRTAEGYRRAAQTFNQAGKRLAAERLTLGYHNHDFEFAPLEGGRTGYEILLAETDPRLVTFELDLFWIRKAGADALAAFRQHKDRFRLVHVKDMAADGTMVDVGQGVMDWHTLLKVARKAGVQHFLVEHDEAKDPLAFAETSYRFMAGLR